uniref:VTT domain-containing protein n=1 Tax=Neobodo designis TaxID=312471 RepID=A0A7S1LJK0_NEODS
MTAASHAADAVSVYIGAGTAAPPPGSALAEKPHKPPPSLTRAAVLRNRVLAAALAIAVIGLIYFEVHTTAVDFWRVVRAHASRETLSSPEKLADFAREVRKVADGRLASVTSLIACIYITLQTFCIPGTIALNVVTGALLGVQFGLPLCVLLGTAGACCCYGGSSIFGTQLAAAVDAKLMKGQGVGKLRASVQRYRSDLFVYLLFLRLTPILPNWLINLGSPVASVPLYQFALATLLGITPQTYLSVRFGTLAQTGGNVKALVTPYDTAAIAALGVIALVVMRLKKRFAGALDAPAAAANDALHDKK